mmetsp:Transcript_10265/g.34224  ORF Transcript_10265/g.34224 Transcript_10265/m.34224 type:complete len:87 (-) Transcript_10265:83-343(-)
MYLLLQAGCCGCYSIPARRKHAPVPAHELKCGGEGDPLPVCQPPAPSYCSSPPPALQTRGIGGLKEVSPRTEEGPGRRRSEETPSG